MIVHIVMFKFKVKDKEANLLKVEKQLNDLVQKIEPLKSIEVGVDFNQSPRAFDLSIYTRFNTKEDLQAYATHPAHIEVVKIIRDVTDESKVVDYKI